MSTTFDPREARKARGAFFTPSVLCSYIADWAIRTPTDRVLEPSAGEAAFLLAAGGRLRSLGADPGMQHLHGVELHAESARTAASLLATRDLRAEIKHSDFFDVAPKREYDVVVGNPPFVRYQDFKGSARAKSQAAALAQGVRLSALANSWAAFVVHSSAFLAPGGRMGLVTPAELLTVNYAAPIRAFLLQRFESIKLVLVEERVFPGVTEEIVLLLAEGEGPTDHFELFQANSLADLPEMEQASWLKHTSEGDGKWMEALLPQEAAELYRQQTHGPDFSPLAEWGDPTLGMVTGANSYFGLTSDRADELGLVETDLLPISPPGSR